MFTQATTVNPRLPHERIRPHMGLFLRLLMTNRCPHTDIARSPRCSTMSKLSLTMSMRLLAVMPVLLSWVYSTFTTK